VPAESTGRRDIWTMSSTSRLCFHQSIGMIGLILTLMTKGGMKMADCLTCLAVFTQDEESAGVPDPL